MHVYTINQENALNGYFWRCVELGDQNYKKKPT